MGAPERPMPPQQLPELPPLLSREPQCLVFPPRLCLQFTTPRAVCAQVGRFPNGRLAPLDRLITQSHHQELRAYANTTSGSQRASVDPPLQGGSGAQATGPHSSWVSLSVSGSLSAGLCYNRFSLALCCPHVASLRRAGAA